MTHHTTQHTYLCEHTNFLILEILWKHRIREFPVPSLQMVGKWAIPVHTTIDEIKFLNTQVKSMSLFSLINVDTHTVVWFFYTMYFSGTLSTKYVTVD